METDEVDPAVEASQQSDKLGGMSEVVIQSPKHGIFKGNAPLPAPVVLTQKGDDIGYGVGFLHRHDTEAFCSHRVVEADSHMAPALFEESFQARDNPHGRDRDAVGAPSQTPRSGKRLDAAENGVKIVHRFTHTHIYYVGEAL